MPARQVLVKARALLVKRGWCQGQSQAIDGAHCARGALCVAIGLESDSELTAPVVIAYRLLCDAGARHGLINFNDTRGRTKAQVLALFSRAIKLAKRGERK